jgi:glucose-1-phosphate adenylyltransferase
VGEALDSLVCSGTIVSGGCVERSVLGHAVRINSWAKVEDSILFEGVDVGRRAQVKNAIIDKGVRIPEGARIGYDRDEDLRRGFTVSDSGIVVLGKLDAFE